MGKVVFTLVAYDCIIMNYTTGYSSRSLKLEADAFLTLPELSSSTLHVSLSARSNDFLPHLMLSIFHPLPCTAVTPTSRGCRIQTEQVQNHLLLLLSLFIHH